MFLILFIFKFNLKFNLFQYYAIYNQPLPLPLPHREGREMRDTPFG